MRDWRSDAAPDVAAADDDGDLERRGVDFRDFAGDFVGQLASMTRPRRPAPRR